jgi:uridine kinase
MIVWINGAFGSGKTTATTDPATLASQVLALTAAVDRRS